MAFELPPVDMGTTERTDKSFDNAEAQLHKARKNRKARKKIKQEHFDSIKQGRSSSVPATQSGTRGHQQANDTFQRTANERGMAQQFSNWSPGANKNNNNLSDVIKVNGQFNAPAIPNVNIGNVGGVKDADSLMGMFTNSQSSQGGLMQSMQTIGKEQTSQLTQNKQIGGMVQKFGKMEQTFGVKENGFKAKEMLFKGLSKTFQGIATAMEAAGTALTTAATSVEAAASACAAIPFVGAAISAVLRAVAQVLKGIAKMLQAIGKQMQGMAKSMDAKGQSSQVAKESMKAQKLASQAKKMANEASLKQGQARLEKIMQSRAQVEKALGVNMNNQQTLAARLQELGRNVQMNGGANGQNQKMQAGMMAAGMAGQAMQSVQAMAMMQQMNQQNQAMMNRPTQQSPTSLGLGGGGSMGGGNFSGGGSQFGGGGGGFRPPAGGVAPAGAAPTGPVPGLQSFTPPPIFRPAAPTTVTPVSFNPVHTAGGDQARTPQPGGLDQNRRGAEGLREDGRKADGQKPEGRKPDDKKTQDKKDPRDKRTEEQKKADQQKAEQQRKAQQARKAQAGRGAQSTGKGLGIQGSASEVRLNYEAQLQQLTGDIESLRGGEGAAKGRPQGIGGRISPTGNLADTARPLTSPGLGATPSPGGPARPAGSTANISGGNIRSGGARAGGGASPGSAGGGSLAEKQQALASLYNQIAEEGVEINGGIESAARRALKGSGTEPAKPITVAREEGAGGQLGGGAAGRGPLAGGPGGQQPGGPGAAGGSGLPGLQMADAAGDLGGSGDDVQTRPQQV